VDPGISQTAGVVGFWDIPPERDWNVSPKNLVFTTMGIDFTGVEISGPVPIPMAKICAKLTGLPLSIQITSCGDITAFTQ
jgi:hypothetical protein